MARLGRSKTKRNCLDDAAVALEQRLRLLVDRAATSQQQSVCQGSADDLAAAPHSLERMPENFIEQATHSSHRAHILEFFLISQTL